MDIAGNNPEDPYDIIDDAGYEAYSVDTTIPKIMANAADSNRFSGKAGSHGQQSRWIPYS
jgi:hypothetical protein